MPLLLSPGPMNNQSGSKLVGGFFGSWVRESGKKIHRPPRGNSWVFFNQLANVTGSKKDNKNICICIRQIDILKVPNMKKKFPLGLLQCNSDKMSCYLKFDI